MRKLHIKIANKETRSKETWLINEKMICNQEGFLIKVDYNNDPISYSFFFIMNIYVNIFLLLLLENISKNLIISLINLYGWLFGI